MIRMGQRPVTNGAASGAILYRRLATDNARHTAYLTRENRNGCDRDNQQNVMLNSTDDPPKAFSDLRSNNLGIGRHFECYVLIPVKQHSENLCGKMT
jgi:hypothetical protein